MHAGICVSSRLLTATKVKYIDYFITVLNTQSVASFPPLAHLLHVPGDPGVQQQIQPLSVVPPGGFHRYEQILRGETLHRPGGSAPPRGAAHRSPLSGEFPEIRRENFSARRRDRRLHRVSAARVTDGDDQHPGHEQTGDRGGGSARCCRGAEGDYWSTGGFPHCDGAGGATASVMDGGKPERTDYNISTVDTQLAADQSASFSGWWPPAALFHWSYKLLRWAGPGPGRANSRFERSGVGGAKQQGGGEASGWRSTWQRAGRPHSACTEVVKHKSQGLSLGRESEDKT